MHVELTAAAGGVELRVAPGPSEGPGVVLWQFLDLLFLGLAFIPSYHQGVCVAHGHLGEQIRAGCARARHGERSRQRAPGSADLAPGAGTASTPFAQQR